MKILILQPDLRIGGIEKSLINFINTFNKDNKIDLFLLRKSGELLKNVPSNVNIIDGSSAVNNYNGIKRKIATLLNLKSFYKKYTAFFNTEYDIAIAYQGLNINTMNILLNCVIAKQKISFLHGDPRCAKKYVLKKALCANKVICVSNSCKNELIKLYPKKKEKVFYLYNLQDNIAIKKLASERCEECFDKSKINFVCIARMTPEKGHLRLLNVIKRLAEENDGSFKFYLIGGGPLFDNVKNKIKKLKIERFVKLLGEQENPYAYLKMADYLVLASYNEAAPMVFGESAILGVPIISTETISAKELVGNFGIVCQNNEAGIYSAIKEALSSHKTYQNENIMLKSKEDYMENFYNIIDANVKGQDNG